MTGLLGLFQIRFFAIAKRFLVSKELVRKRDSRNIRSRLHNTSSTVLEIQVQLLNSITSCTFNVQRVHPFNGRDLPSVPGASYTGGDRQNLQSIPT